MMKGKKASINKERERERELVGFKGWVWEKIAIYCGQLHMHGFGEQC